MSNKNYTLYGEGKELANDGVELTLANERSGTTDQTGSRTVLDIAVIFLVTCFLLTGLVYVFIFSGNWSAGAFDPAPLPRVASAPAGG